MDKFAINPNPLSRISMAAFEELDVDTMRQVVQGERADLLEVTLKDQMKEMHRNNETIAKFNEMTGIARELMAQFGPDDKTDKTFSDLIKDQRKEFQKTDEWKEMRDAAEAAKILELSKPNPRLEYIETRLRELDGTIKSEWANSPEKSTHYPIYLDKFSRSTDPRAVEMRSLVAEQIKLKKEPQFNNGNIALGEFDAEIKAIADANTKASKILEDLKASAAAAGKTFNINNKGELQALVDKTKSEIDSLSNEQSMNLLRAQSITNKHTETVDARTNALKKEHELRSKVQSNT